MGCWVWGRVSSLGEGFIEASGAAVQVEGLQAAPLSWK